MKHKQQTIFIIIGTLLFAFLVYSLATSDYNPKKTRWAPNAQTWTKTKVYKNPDLKSKIIDSLPENTDITIGKGYANFYKIIKANDHPSSKAGFIPKETVIKTK